MISFAEIKKSLWAALWFMFLTFPIMVIRVNTIDNTIAWRWDRLLWVGLGSFVLSLVWRRLMRRRQTRQGRPDAAPSRSTLIARQFFKNPRIVRPALVLTGLFFLALPFVFSWHQTIIMTNVLIYVVVALGLNIVVGLAGLLDLGYVAFFAVGAYSYALLNYHFGIGFWLALPIGAGLGTVFGLLLGLFPILAQRRHQAGGTLSGGEQQMQAIARALMARPRLLLLDEPSLGLAPLVVGRIFDIIRQINAENNTTILLVEQNANLALKVAHRGYVMENGRIILEESAERLMANDQVRKAYLGL
ncbi:ABC transporter permease subunit [Desulfatitalea tepidiphila]|uniref:ABC transporter permease subunit n=1 Tax=Desulfatitalea tepidiphila TaxID=1185843 RepID=UPI0006B46427|nr:ATP-binding cassette domain-containing protein [Desulfatitalea tepidiphila]